MIFDSKNYNEVRLMNSKGYLQKILDEKTEIDEIVVLIKYSMKGVTATFQQLQSEEL